MPEEDNLTNYNDPTVKATLPSRCVHLRSNGMYVRENAAGDEPIDDDDFGPYWCFQTMKSFGPDDGIVGAMSCRDRLRSCYDPL